MNTLEFLASLSNVETIKSGISTGIVKFPSGLSELNGLDNGLSKSGHPRLAIQFQSVLDDKAYISEFLRTSTVARMQEKMIKIHHIINHAPVSKEVKDKALQVIANAGLKESVERIATVETPKSILEARGIKSDDENYQDENQKIMDTLRDEYQKSFKYLNTDNKTVEVIYKASFNTIKVEKINEDSGEVEVNYVMNVLHFAGKTLEEKRSSQQRIVDAYENALQVIVDNVEGGRPAYNLTIADKADGKGQYVQMIKPLA